VQGILCLALAALFCPAIALGAASDSAPGVTITAPEEGLTIATRVVTVEAAFTAPEGALIKLAELVIDGVTVDARKLDPPAESGTVSFTWLARDYADGKHRIAVRAIGSDGQVAKAAIAVVLKSAEAGRASGVRIISPADGETVSGNTTIQVEVDDPTVARYVIFLVDDVLKAISNVRPLNYVWDTTRYLNGIHVLKAQACSGRGWEAVSLPVQVQVDNPSGLTAMREPKAAVTPVAPEPAAPPARAGEPVLPPPVRSESPAPAYPAPNLPTPELAVPGTAPFVSPSGELISPPPPPPVQIAALPALSEQPPAPPYVPLVPAQAPETPSLAPGLPSVPTEASPETWAAAPSLAPADSALTPIPPAERTAPIERAPASAPVEIVMLPADDLPKAGGRGHALPTTRAETAPEAAPVAPAEHAPDLAEVTSAPVAGAELVPARERPSAPVQIAMLPPKPVEATPAPRVAAEPMPTRIAYVVRTNVRLDRLAAGLGLPAAEIARANNIAADSVISAGQRLAIPSTPVAFDGKPLAFDAPAVIADGRAIVPFRKVMEEAGGQVTWDSKQRRASAIARGHEITVAIGSDQAQVDGSAVAMGSAAQIRCDRTVVPLRFLGDALDLALQYQDGVIHIASAR
jgi:LysM repeat protein